MSKTVQVTPCQDPTAQVIAALNQVRSEHGLPPLATTAQAELDTMKKELEHTKEELKETKQIFEHTKEAFKTAIYTLKDDNERLENEKDRLQSKIDVLEEKNRDLQLQIIELTTKEDEPEDPHVAVPAPNRPAKLQHWYFCQYLLDLDRDTKKYYNTFRNKWVIVMNTARGVGGRYQKKVEELNNSAIRDLQGMINELEALYVGHKYADLDTALQYLKKVQAELGNQNA